MRKIIWIAVSGLMVISLVVAACGTATPTTPTIPTTPTTPASPTTPATPTAPTAPTETPQQKEVVDEGSPKYGGTLTRTVDIDPAGWDVLPTPLHQATGANPVSHSLWIGDWAKGPAGTGEMEDLAGGRFASMTGQLFDSWEVFPDGHTVYHLTKGVHYGLNPMHEASRLVGGREWTAYDAEYSIKRQQTGSYQARSIPEAAADMVVTALDKYTLQIEIYPEQAYAVNYFFGSYHFADIPKEVIDKYGDMNQWNRVVGTGPFLLTDYVPASQISFVKNPNYFRKDPAGPGKGNQLPYLDAMKILIVPDVSTRMAAIRTGKIDVLDNLSVDDAAQLRKTSPELETYDGYGGANAMFMRTDIPELPYHDKRVRRALYMATDFEAINKAIRGGIGTNPGWPLAYTPSLSDYFLHIKDAPASVQELYQYNPEKAKQLLAEAGYPEGFTATVVVSAAGAYVDEVAILKDMWAKVGVILELDLKEAGAFRTISNFRRHTDMIYAGIGGTTQLWPRGMGNIHGGVGFNLSYIDEPYVNEAVEQFHAAWLNNDEAERIRLSREVVIPGVLDDAWAVGMPASRVTTFWWPWVKNYYGANAGAFQGFPHQYLWIDQGLKKSMGH